MTGALLGLLILVGCPKKAAVATDPVTLEPAESAARRVSVDGPSYWTEGGGLCLEVPAEWAGTSGPPPHLLSLTHSSGVQLDVRTWSIEDPLPLVRPDYELLFHDTDTYRAVPVLRGGGTYTWVSVDAKGPLTQGWYGPQGDRIVAVEATYPFGEATAGREVVQPLLTGLCTTFE